MTSPTHSPFNTVVIVNSLSFVLQHLIPSQPHPLTHSLDEGLCEDFNASSPTAHQYGGRELVVVPPTQLVT